MSLENGIRLIQLSLFRYVSLWKGSLTLYLGKYGVLERLGE